MKVAFCTCVQIGKSCIEAVLSIAGKFDLLLTLHDYKSTNKSGRIFLDEIAQRFKIPLYKFDHINDQIVSDLLRYYEIDWLFIIGWSQIASKDLLAIPKNGVIGAHPSLLPVGRGRASIPWAIIKGLDKTGVTFFKMDEGVDTGDILGQFEISLTQLETATSLYEKVNQAHVELIKQIWPKLIQDDIVCVKQNEGLATYWNRRSPSDGELKDNMSLSEVEILVRATTKPYPGAFKLIDNNKKLIVWSGSLDYHQNALPMKFLDGIYYAIEIEYQKIESFIL
jgi:methionyl-tRNA formyltransferase